MPFLAHEFAHVHCRYYCNNYSDGMICSGTISIASFVRTGEPIHKLKGGQIDTQTQRSDFITSERKVG
jgi:hypothetical protein